MLLNLTNHPSANWPENQLKAASENYGHVQDLPFPQIDPDWDEARIDRLSKEYFEQITELRPQAVHIMGEMTFTYRLVELLKTAGIPCIASTTVRRVSEKEGRKTSVFNFVKFREY